MLLYIAALPVVFISEHLWFETFLLPLVSTVQFQKDLENNIFNRLKRLSVTR